jgi:hypothetical protein
MTCFSGWRRLGAYAADETSIRFLRRPSTAGGDAEEDFCFGTRGNVLHPFDGDWKIARCRMLLDQAVLTAKNLSIFF